MVEKSRISSSSVFLSTGLIFLTTELLSGCSNEIIIKEKVKGREKQFNMKIEKKFTITSINITERIQTRKHFINISTRINRLYVDI